MDTRRRAASDLVQALSTQFEKEIVAIFSAYVSALLQEYAASPQKNWRQKDVALFLVTTLASRAQTVKVFFDLLSSNSKLVRQDENILI